MLNIQEVAQSIIKQIEVSERQKECLSIAISGFPTCGKTILAKLIHDFYRNKSVFIDIDCWILDYEIRKTLDVSGTSPDAYEVTIAVNAISMLKMSRGVCVRQYDHFMKKRLSCIKLSTVGKEVMVVDGCILIDNRFQGCYDLLIFLFPRSKSQWLKNAVYRDTKDRFFASKEAERHNLRKFNDMIKLFEEGYHNVDLAFVCEGSILQTDSILLYEKLDDITLESIKTIIEV